MPKNGFTRKLYDFDSFTKIALEWGRLGQINCCQRLEKVAQSLINRQIWSHWTGVVYFYWPAIYGLFLFLFNYISSKMGFVSDVTYRPINLIFFTLMADSVTRWWIKKLPKNKATAKFTLKEYLSPIPLRKPNLVTLMAEFVEWRSRSIFKSTPFSLA